MSTDIDKKIDPVPSDTDIAPVIAESTSNIPPKKRCVSLIIIALFAISTGYWLGNKLPSNHLEFILNNVSHDSNSQSQVRKILYYRNPMGQPDTSLTPKKDSMGMDYIPVYADEQTQDPALATQVKINANTIQQLGVKTAVASLRVLEKTVQATGRVEADERRIYIITSKFEGYIEQLHVNTTGQLVNKNQLLFEVYSPELVSAQQEYAIAMQGVVTLKNADSKIQTGIQQLAASSLARLKNWDISTGQIQALSKSGKILHTLMFRSPFSGIVTEKQAVQGMRFMPGETLYQITDLSNIWVIADVFEQDISLVTAGAKAKLTITSYPNKTFEGIITYIYPTLNIATRTIPIRIELPNPKTLLKPGMFAQVALHIQNECKVVTVPNTAIIDSGTSQTVLVQVEPGRYASRKVKLGVRSDDYSEILEGIANNEKVVVAANFLIDAESNLQATLSRLQHTNDKSDDHPLGQQSVAGHLAEGTIDEIKTDSDIISVSHKPVAGLNWPAMTMDFMLANKSLIKNLTPGAAIDFEFVERGPGEWVITNIIPKVETSTKTTHRHQ